MKKTEPMVVSVLPALKKKIDAQAKKADTTRSSFIRKAIIEFINRKPTKADFKREF